MKTNIGILVNVEGVPSKGAPGADTLQWLAAVIRSGIAVQYATNNAPVRPVECDETNGVITINEARP